MKLALLLLALVAGASAHRVISGRYIAVTIGDKDCDVTSKKYGARGDGKHDDTKVS